MLKHDLLAPFSFEEARKEGGFHVNCLGAKARNYFPDDWFDITDRIQPNEEAFEWLDVFETVLTAGRVVTFVDLGAGYGRWLVNAAIAARQVGKESFLVGVEAEETHYRWMLEHLADNEVAPSDFRVIHAAVSDEVREVYFTDGNSQEWYGQSIIPSPHHGYGDWPESRVVRLRSVAAANVFADLDLIDGLHMDIQGEEERVLPAIISLLDKHVRRVHIGTHSIAIHAMIGRLFESHGWTPRRIVPFRGSAPSELGPIRVNDGIQSWRNPRLGSLP